jgi:ABC-type glycerol-3-phosphate transport system substrate-binding protein
MEALGNQSSFYNLFPYRLILSEGRQMLPKWFDKQQVLSLVLTAIVIISTSCSRPLNTATIPAKTQIEPTIREEQGQNLNGGIVTFAVPFGQQNLYLSLLTEFHQQHPDITVMFVEPPTTPPWDIPREQWDYLKDLAKTADVTIITGQDIPQAGSYFKDLAPLIEADSTYQSDDFWPGVLASSQDRNGHTVCIPLTLGIHGIYFNEQAFTDAGLPLPTPGWTWDDFRKAIRILTIQPKGSVRYGFADGDTTTIFTDILSPLVDAYLIENDGKIDAEMLQIQLQWYFDLVNQKALYGLKASNLDERTALFQSDTRPAMWTGYLADMLPGSKVGASNTDAWSGMTIETNGFVPFPVDQGHSATSPAYVYCVAISSGAQESQAAWLWVKFLSQQWVSLPEAGASGIAPAPARKSVAEKVNYWKKLPEKAVPAVQFGLSHAWFGPKYPREFGIVQTAMLKSLSGQKDFATELSIAEASAGAEAKTGVGTITVATPLPTVSSEETAILYAVDDYEVKPAIQAMADAFNRAHPDTMVGLTFGNLGADIFAGKPIHADCFSTTGHPIPQEYLLSLDSFFTSESTEFTQDYSPSVLDAFRINGELYGLPVTIGPPVLVYNATLLTKRGLKPPTNDWSFQDFTSLITTAASSGEGNSSYGFLMNSSDYFWILAGRRVTWMNFDSVPPSLELDSSEMVSALSWMSDLYKTGAVIPWSSENSSMILGEQDMGKIAFWSAEPGGDDPHALNWGHQSEFGILPLPSMPNPPTIDITITSHYISKTARNAQVCWEWLNFLSEQSNAFPGIPARRSVAASPTWETLVGKNTAEVYQLAVTRVQPETDMLEYQRLMARGVSFKVIDAVNAVLFQGTDPQQALVEAQANAQAYLDCMAQMNYTKLNHNELVDKNRLCLSQ